MKEIIGNRPTCKCPTCSTEFTYDASDVEKDIVQYWAGFWEGGWLTKEVRYVTCPICAAEIKLR